MSLGTRSDFNQASYQDSRFSSHLDIHTIKQLDARSTPKKGHLKPSNHALIPDRFGLNHSQAKSLSDPSASDFGFGVLTMGSTKSANSDDLLGSSPRTGIQSALTSATAVDTSTPVTRIKHPALTVDPSDPVVSVGKARAPVIPLGNDPSDPTPVSVTRIKHPALTVDPSDPVVSVGKARAPVIPLGNDPSDPTPVSVTRGKHPALTVDPSDPVVSVGKARVPVIPLGNQTLT
jgi:hypothetical protein